jgi:hypothetical protein
MGSFTPSTVPGCRTPHLWLRDGRSLYDAAGHDYALLRFDPEVDVSAFIDAACRHCVPLSVLDVDADDSDGVYREKLVLSRPDQHIAWRGNELPHDPVELVDRIRGASGSPMRD